MTRLRLVIRLSEHCFIGGGDTDIDPRSDIFSFKVKGYPTILYFVDGDTEGEKYTGARDFDSPKKFVTDKLEVKCDVSNPVECSEKEKTYIEKMKTKAKEERAKQITRLEGMASDPMKAELKAWLHQRLHILRMLERV